MRISEVSVSTPAVAALSKLPGAKNDPNSVATGFWFLLFALSLIVLFFFVRKRGIQKGEAVTILALYGGYVILKFSNTF